MSGASSDCCTVVLLSIVGWQWSNVDFDDIRWSLSVVVVPGCPMSVVGVLYGDCLCGLSLTFLLSLSSSAIKSKLLKYSAEQS